MAKSTQKVMTPIFRTSFVKLAEPDKTDNGKDRYSITMIFDEEAQKTEEFKQMKAAVEEAKKLAWAGKKLPNKLKTPFREGTEDEYDLEKYPEYEGNVIVTASSVEHEPDVRDADTFKADDKRIIYSGCYARAFVVAYGYGPSLRPGSKGGDGVTFGLQAVQFAYDGERLGGAPTNAGKDFTPFHPPEKEGNHEDLLEV